MPSSWTQNFYHCVFSTKGRLPWIEPSWERRLHAFIGGIAKDLKCDPYAINGMAEHVHVLVRFPSDLSCSDLVKHVKFRSSKWVHETFDGMRQFAWQEGYGGFTVSKSQVPRVEKYIVDQKVKHQRMNYEAEFLGLLRKHGWRGEPEEVLR